jgi:nanoRNase/pAp phosphatase (c-di-AMP/oligoRNAs hydrolase)
MDFRDEDIYYVNHGLDNKIDRDIQKNLSKYNVKECNVFISDISPNTEKIFEWLIKNCKSVTVLDHHKSQEHYQKYGEFIYTSEKCATRLVKEYLERIGKWDSPYIKDWNYYVEIVNDFDLWLLKNSFSKDLNNLFYFMGLTKFVDIFTKKPYMLYRYNDIIEILQNSEKKYIEKTLSTKLPAICGGEYVFCELYINEVANEIARNNDAKIGIAINMKNKSVSLRSIGDTSVLIIAEMNGGGGHKNASGFTFDTIEEINRFIKTGRK